MTAKKTLAAHSENYSKGLDAGYVEACISVSDAIMAMIDYAEMAVAADRKNLLKHIRLSKDLGEDKEGVVQFETSQYFYDEEDYPIYLNEDSLINAPNIILE